MLSGAHTHTHIRTPLFLSHFFSLTHTHTYTHAQTYNVTAVI